MSILKLKSYVLDETSDYTFNNIVVNGTAGLPASNAISIADGVTGQVLTKAADGTLNWTQLFSGSYTDLTNIPTTFTPVQATNATLGGIIPGTGLSIDGTGTVTVNFPAETDPIFTSHAAYNITATNIVNWTTAYNWGNHANAGYAVSSSLASVATSGSYIDLTNKPSIPTDLTSLGITDGTAGQALTTNGAGVFSFTSVATAAYVDASISNLIDNSPAVLDTLNELAAALGDDPNFATTISNQIGLKANSADLATVATSGSYNDLINKPTLFSGSYTDLTNKPSIPASLTDLGITDGTVNQVLSTDGAGNFSFVTISAASGIALTDISASTTAASNGGSLTYNNTTGVFTFAPADLSNYVQTSSLATVATSGLYSDLTGTPTALSSFTNDVGFTTFDGAYSSLTGAPTIPTALTDLSITDGTSGQVLTTDGAGNFSFTTVTSGTTINSINDIADVVITSVSTGDVLVFDGTDWVNGQVSGSSGVFASSIVDTFVGDGTTNIFTLGFASNAVASLVVSYNGIVQLNTSYTLSGNTLTLSEAPEIGYPLEVYSTIYDNGSIPVTELVGTTEAQTLTNKTITGLLETQVSVSGTDIDLATANYFTWSASSALLSVSNIPSAGKVASFIIEISNGGDYSVSWWSGITWSAGTAPTLTSGGLDILGFYTSDGGTTWRGLVLAQGVA